MELNKETTSFARKEAVDLWRIVNLGISYEADDPEQRNMCELIQNSVDNVFLEAGMYADLGPDPITIDTKALRIIGFHGVLALKHSEAVIRGFCSQFNGCSTDYYPEHESDANAAFENLETIVQHTATELGAFVMNTLIVGGSSGLGLEIARNAEAAGEYTIITGRHDPAVDFAEYREFELSLPNLPNRIREFVMDLPPIKSLVYAAGFYQEGRITDLGDDQVDEMINVCGRGLVFFVKKLLEKQGYLKELVAITSTSQWIPRELEPVYNFSKAGVGHFCNGLSLDPAIGKVMVVGPSGMATSFWQSTDRDTSDMMDPAWVAKEVELLRKEKYTYQFAKILGAFQQQPHRTEIVETR